LRVHPEFVSISCFEMGNSLAGSQQGRNAISVSFHRNPGISDHPLTVSAKPLIRFAKGEFFGRSYTQAS
jgi:hypothetical protein